MRAGGRQAIPSQVCPPAETRRERSVLTGPAAPPAALTADEAQRFRALVMPHADAAYNLALRLCRRTDVAEDIVHDAWVRALAGFVSFRGGDAKSWILTIVRNRFYDWAREQRLKGMARLTRPANDSDDADPDWDVADVDQPTPEDQMVGKTEVGALHALIDRLPPRLREVIVLRELEELSYREIAQVTESPIGSVMSRLSRAREALARAWREREAQMAGVRP